MFAIGDKVEQTANQVTSKVGWVGEVKGIDGNYVYVKFDKHDKELAVPVKYLKGVNVATGDKNFQDLIATANKGAAALRELVKKYPTKIHYNSPKFKSGKDHLCEKGARLLEFDLVAKEQKVINFPRLTLGTFTADLVDANDYVISFDGEDFAAEDLYDCLKELLEGAGESAGYTATRKGIECDGGVLSWEHAEVLTNAIKNSGMLQA